MKVRRIKLGSAVEFYINDEQARLFYIMRGVGALYELCATSATSRFTLLTKSIS